MGGAWCCEYSDRFLRELRALDEPTRARVVGYMRAIVADPASKQPHFRALPPPFMPGSIGASFADYVIEYRIERSDDDDGENGRRLRFLRLILRW